ncbi:hypothetical protein G6M86_20845 [Agrobacterium tumefaciens]|uniref:Uncharacterized protein n=1 Tax=Agrobacterium tumefaciens TaxID=358 RepID=A0AAJ4N6F9_AGRTU|nr:hypothetical protein G6M86_20845 [Agrobacterium tumefaciens]
MAKKKPKGGVKIDIGLNKTKGGIAKSAVKQDTGKIAADSLMGRLAEPLKKSK